MLTSLGLKVTFSGSTPMSATADAYRRTTVKNSSPAIRVANFAINPLQLQQVHRSRCRWLLSAILLMTSISALAADKVSGKVSFKTTSSAIKFAWLVRGPDDMDASKTILRIYLSSSDIGAQIKTCRTLSCADRALADGAMVDFSDARHLSYSVSLNGGHEQYSGATDASAFTLSMNKPEHLAGKLHIDDASAGGAKIDADFDLALANTFKTAR